MVGQDFGERERKKKRVLKAKDKPSAKDSPIYKNPLNGLNLVKIKPTLFDGWQVAPGSELDCIMEQQHRNILNVSYHLIIFHAKRLSSFSSAMSP